MSCINAWFYISELFLWYNMFYETRNSEYILKIILWQIYIITLVNTYWIMKYFGNNVYIQFMIG